ncbi:glycosyltransferase family A protein [Vibrio owensii]|uniref:glycosyltransferase family A protein n=1 Tax=Vibrio owensii TaxID=696485 RepID=UPI00215B8E96|nr:glycosyltransferase family 2 protein [Vibrio owensii]MCR9944548.1 glycosyltransferase family 2 protein [Vibrio owensii]
MNVAVIITTKDRPDFLARAIYSLLSQSCLPSEIVVVDDHSNTPISTNSIDNFISKANKKGISFSYYYNEQPKGGNFSRNFGVKNSSSDIIMFLDDDDSWEQHKIKDQVSILERDRSIGLVYTGKVFVYDTDLESSFRRSHETKATQSIWCGNFIGSTSGVAVLRATFLLAGQFDEKLQSLQDYDLWIRILKETKVVWDGEHNLRYTIHSNRNGQVTSNVDKHLATVNYLKNKYKDELSLIPSKQKRVFNSRLDHVIARAYRRNNDIRFVKFFLKSLLGQPSLRTLALIFSYD